MLSRFSLWNRRAPRTRSEDLDILQLNLMKTAETALEAIA